MKSCYGYNLQPTEEIWLFGALCYCHRSKGGNRVPKHGDLSLFSTEIHRITLKKKKGVILCISVENKKNI